MSAASTSTPVVAFKKGPSRRPAQTRKRSSSPPLETSGSPSTTSDATVVRPTKKSLANPLVQGSKRRREANDENANSGGLDELDYKADEGLIRAGDEYATRANDWDLENEDGTIEKKKIRLNEDGEIVTDDGLYRGAANYLPTINKTREVLDKKMKAGPIKATSNIRTITLVDYQPDVCKDYKETGFCGYGDSCKFLHDRGDYLAGWQLDQAWDAAQGQGQAAPEEDDEEEVPFACLICRKEFTDPVVTKCGHYFCMKCAIERFIKSPKCYACGAPTSGIFNKAEKILAKLEAKNKAKREARGIVDEDNGNGGIEIGGPDSDAEGSEMRHEVDEEGEPGLTDMEDDD